MHEQALRCVTKGHKGEIWKIVIADDGNGTLYDAAGRQVIVITPANVQSVVQMPSFGDSIKYYGIQTPAGFFQFHPGDRGVKPTMNAFYDQTLNQSIVAGGTAAVEDLRKAGQRELLIGLGVAALGIVITAATYTAAASNPNGGSYIVTYGLIVAGVIGVFRGLSKLSRAGDLAPAATTGFEVQPAMPMQTAQAEPEEPVSEEENQTPETTEKEAPELPPLPRANTGDQTRWT